VAAFFGKLPEDDKILRDALVDTYRVDGYHPEHDAEESDTKTDSGLRTPGVRALPPPIA
jgi:hypothetical protein